MKFKSKYFYILLGCFMCLGSLWLGSYISSLFPRDSWQLFPTYATTFLFFIVGLLFLLLEGFLANEHNHKEH